MQAVDVVVRAGKGSENGGVYLDCKQESLSTMRWMYQRNAQLLKEKFGYDFTSQPTEVVPEMYEHGGEPSPTTTPCALMPRGCSVFVLRRQ